MTRLSTKQNFIFLRKILDLAREIIDAGCKGDLGTP
jgi:hypothetical protein